LPEIVGRSVREAWADDSGLRLLLDDGTSVLVAPDPVVEAWELVGPGDFFGVGVPK
jgi:hypothetical protein